MVNNASKKPRCFILRGSLPYAEMMKREGWELVYAPVDADMVLFTGGEDVTPSYYGEDYHPKTFNSLTRDTYEKGIFDFCKKNMITMAGICRGGQFLNVMNGGKMYQHVTEHTKEHVLCDIATGEEILVSSTHHQMMRPGFGAEFIAFADEGGIKEFVGTDKKVKQIGWKEPDAEVLFYPDTESLCFQPHPEFWNGKDDSPFKPMNDYFFRLIEELLNLKGAK